ncbi:hypothetical protein AUI06_11535 [archaeon 13_2_20CM_2_52_21]|nr:MAG: hypothetical protein AUI06_11535 [archaeon 13_2_20CM_2_52_21]
MAKTGKKSHAPKRPIKSKKALGKVRTKPTNHTRASPKTSSRKTISGTHHQQSSDATYIFECTRPGCGYRIPREEKAEQGSLRFDLKCPKCHNREFKCLGKGDLPTTFELPVPTTNIDFDNIKPVDLGSN